MKSTAKSSTAGVPALGLVLVTLTCVNGDRQRPRTTPMGPPGPSYSRNVPETAALGGERFPPHAPMSSARTVYQKVRA